MGHMRACVRACVRTGFRLSPLSQFGQVVDQDVLVVSKLFSGEREGDNNALETKVRRTKKRSEQPTTDTHARTHARTRARVHNWIQELRKGG